MNKTAQRQVTAIMDAETAYMNSTGTALLQYRQRKAQICDAAKAYTDEVYSELCEVMAGQPAPNKTSKGYRSIGNTWSTIQLLTNGKFIAHNLKEIKAAADAWSADVTYQIREHEHDEEVARAEEEAENAGEEYKPEREPVSTTSVEKRGSNGVELAAELGRQISENNANAAKTVQHYAK